MRILAGVVLVGLGACASATAPVPSAPPATACWVTVPVPHVAGGSFSLHYKVCPAKDVLDKDFGVNGYTTRPG